MAIASSKNLGEVLRATRQQKGLSVDDVTRDTKIRPRFIEALEVNNYKVFASPLHARGFLTSYAKFLEIDPARALSLYRRDAAIRNKEEGKALPAWSLPRVQLTKNKRLALATLVVLVAIFSFAFHQIRQALQPPLLELTSPITLAGPTEFSLEANTDSVVIQGLTNTNAILRINNSALPLDPTGRFATSTLPISGSRTTFVIKATSALGQENIIILNFVRSVPETEN